MLWGLGEISLVSPVLLKIVDKMKSQKKEITVENSMRDIVAIMPFIVEEMFEIIAITIGISLKEAKGIKPRQDTTAIALEIILQNVSYLKNLPGLLPMIVGTIQG